VIDLEAARKQSSWARATKGTQSWCNRGLLIAAEFFVTAGAWEPAPSQVDIAGGLDDAALLVAVPALHRRGCMTRRVSLNLDEPVDGRPIRGRVVVGITYIHQWRQAPSGIN
jgi:hypothetical protein